MEQNKAKSDLVAPDLAHHDVLLRKTETKKETKKTNKKEVPENNVLEPIQDDQLVSHSLSYFAEVANPDEIDPKQEIKADLQRIGLSTSQITALLRVHTIEILEQAVTETFQAQYERRINERASQYFYGVLNNLHTEQ